MSFSCTDAVDPKVQKNKKIWYEICFNTYSSKPGLFNGKKNPSWTSRGSTKTGGNLVLRGKKGKEYSNLEYLSF